MSRELEGCSIRRLSNPGVQEWGALTQWVVTQFPLASRAMLYNGTSTEAVSFIATIDALLADVLKKINFSHQGRVNLDPPPPPNAPQQSKSFLVPFSLNLVCF